MSGSDRDGGAKGSRGGKRGGALAGRGAVITGGGRGIGAATARALAAKGARVVVSARSEGEIEAVAAELRDGGAEAWAVPCDVTDPASILALRDAAFERLGAVDILVANAGIATSAPLHAIQLGDWNRLFAVNVTGVFLCAQAFVPAMAERGWGRVINVASIAGRMGAPYITAYAATKHAVVGFTRALGQEVAAKGVTVNAVCPGYVDTPMTDASIARIVARTGLDPADTRMRLESASPQSRLMEADEVAWLVVSLCRPEARGINAQAIVLDGGGVQG
jgi:NAD(P)-dependent dehydrogenase (short-subunit alcohol dehydrogenase family)